MRVSRMLLPHIDGIPKGGLQKSASSFLKPEGTRPCCTACSILCVAPGVRHDGDSASFGRVLRYGRSTSRVQWIWILPLRSVPPSVDPPETEMLNASVTPGSPLSVTPTVKVHGTPLLRHVPPNVAVVSATKNELNVTLCI